MIFKRPKNYNLNLAEIINLIKAYGIMGDSKYNYQYRVDTQFGPILLTESNFEIRIMLQDSPCTSIGLIFDKIDNAVTGCYADKERYSLEIELDVFMTELVKRINGINKSEIIREKIQSGFTSYLMSKFEVIHIYENKYNYSENMDDPIKKKRQKEFDDNRENNKQFKIKTFEENLNEMVKNHSRPSFINHLNFLPKDSIIKSVGGTESIFELLKQNRFYKEIIRILDTIYNVHVELKLMQVESQDRIFLVMNYKNSL